MAIQKIYSSSLPLSSSSLLLSSDGGSSLNSTSSTGSSCSISLSRDALITWELSDDKLIKTASSVRMVRLPWYGQVLSLRDTISIGQCERAMMRYHERWNLYNEIYKNPPIMYLPQVKELFTLGSRKFDVLVCINALFNPSDSTKNNQRVLKLG